MALASYNIENGYDDMFDDDTCIHCDSPMTDPNCCRERVKEIKEVKNDQSLENIPVPF